MALRRAHTSEADYWLKGTTHHRATAQDLLGPAGDSTLDDSPWGPGDAGYEWKRRWLSERRAMALEYQFNPNKRQPITNAVRQRAALNEARLRQAPSEHESPADVTMAALFQDDEGEAAHAAESARARYLSALASRSHYSVPIRGHAPVNGDVTPDELALIDEAGGDTLAHLSYRDVEALADELYGAAAAATSAQGDEMLRKWAGLRRSTGQQTLSSVPHQYRLPWTPWYLTNLPR